MSKQNEKKQLSTLTKNTIETPEKVILHSEVTKPAKKPELLLSFDNWFATTKKPTHHKAGMLVYLNARKIYTRTKRTVSAWDSLLANY